MFFSQNVLPIMLLSPECAVNHGFFPEFTVNHVIFTPDCADNLGFFKNALKIMFFARRCCQSCISQNVLSTHSGKKHDWQHILGKKHDWEHFLWEKYD
jgi:hypothetical protein